MIRAQSMPAANRRLASPRQEGVLPGTSVDLRYPDSNGRFMGDTDYHNLALSQIREDLEDYYVPEPDVYVASNLVMYYKKNDARCRRDPDILVVKGVGKHRRRSFRFWEEKKKPRVLFEVASRRTWRNDIGSKRWLYARLDIKEYFLFDPEERYLDPPLQGFRTVHGKSVPIKPEPDGSLISRELGLKIVIEGDSLRFINLQTGEPILRRWERAELEARRANQEQQRADQEKQQAQEEKRRAERERQRAEQEQQRAEQEKQRAEQQKQRAEQEKQRAELLAAEVVKLTQRIAELES